MHFSNFAFRKLTKLSQKEPVYDENASTLAGVLKKSFLLIGITFITAIISIILVGIYPLTYFVYLPILVIDFIFMLIILFVPKAAKGLSIPYAVMEGVMAGCIAGLLELAVPGYGLSTAGLAFIITCAIVLVASVLYFSGTVRVTSRFRKVMYTILLSIVIVSLIGAFLAIFFPTQFWLVRYNPTISIIISAIFVIIASVYVTISLDNAMVIVNNGIHKDYEWYAAFGLLINVIWLFYEVLRLLITILSTVRGRK